MINIEKQIEFDKVKELWKGCAVTQWARDTIDGSTFILSQTQLRGALTDTTNAKRLMERLGTPPLQNVSEAREVLLIADKGECLMPYQLERIEKVLVAVKRLKQYLEKGKDFENSLAYYEVNLDPLEELREEISRQIRGGAVDDYASKELGQLRLQIGHCEEQIRLKAEQIMRSNKECMADTYSTIRNGRVCVPVKKEYKFKIAGSVIDKSSTGNTLFVEPAGVTKYYEELQNLRITEENEVYRILYTLTAMVADCVTIMEDNLHMIEKLDFVLSKGKLSMDMDAVEPYINTNRRIILKDARHPLMDPKVNIPLQFALGEEVNGIVITGPNTGGKTVAIKTVMLTCMMAQCGLHVTCREAEVCMSSGYLCDIGDGQNLAENLSTFSAHIKNVLQVLEVVNRESFVIMDELGSGTDPSEGMGIAVAILEQLRKSGALFLVTTHYPELKEYADKMPDICNARMTFDKETLKPTYQMVIGEAGESCAFYIAERLGMPKEMLQTAIRTTYGEKAVEKYVFMQEDNEHLQIAKAGTGIQKTKKSKDVLSLREKYEIGDSVMLYPDKKIGIVCEPINEKGVLRVQLPDKKIYINHKRVKLHVSAAELYPEDYDFSIIFETIENRKMQHDMRRKYTTDIIRYEE